MSGLVSGIYSDAMIEDLIRGGMVHVPEPLAHGQVQPASLDLRLGRRCWRMRASFLLGRTAWWPSELLIMHCTKLT